jgi:hypothetical protein
LLPGTVFPLAPGHKVAGSTRPARVDSTAARHSDAIAATGEIMISMRCEVRGQTHRRSLRQQ